MPVLIDPKSGLAQDLDEEASQSAITNGWKVPLTNQAGQPVSLPYDLAQKAVSEGTHTQPTPDQLQNFLEHGHYSGTGQKALAFLEGAAEPLSMGAYGPLASASGATTPEDILKRAHYNPESHTLGEMAGITTGLAIVPEESIPG